MKLVKVTIAAALAGAAMSGGVAQAAVGDPAPSAASLATRHFDATVVSRTSTRASNRSFLARSSGRNIRFRVNRATVFERVSFAGLRRGMSIQIEAVLRNGRWVATHVERDRNNNNNDGDNRGPGRDGDRRRNDD